ncbi:Histone deacetylase complex subunit sap18 [Linnemannia zychae]|nr:Histone deacetylase complex subunit sap18 [Linnemannia zychae]
MTEVQEPTAAVQSESVPEPAAAITTDSTAGTTSSTIAETATTMTAMDTNEPTTTATNTAPSTTATAAPAPASGIIDREKLCPFLLKMFYKQGEHNRVDWYSPTATPPKSSELQLYTWKNATLGEIASLVKQAIPDLIDSSLPGGGELKFRHIFLDLKRGIFVGRDIGNVMIADMLVAEDEESGAGGVEGAGEGEDVEMKTDGEASGDVDPAQGILTKDIRRNKENANAPGSVFASAAIAAATRTSATASPARRSTALEKTLSSIRFVIGDYLDIAIISRTDASGKAIVTGGGREHALFTGRHGRNAGGGGGGGGPSRNNKRRGGGGRRGGDVVDRFAGRLGLVESSDRNGHGGHGISRRGTADMETSWKGRGRGR